MSLVKTECQLKLPQAIIISPPPRWTAHQTHHPHELIPHGSVIVLPLHMQLPERNHYKTFKILSTMLVGIWGDLSINWKKEIPSAYVYMNQTKINYDSIIIVSHNCRPCARVHWTGGSLLVSFCCWCLYYISENNNPSESSETRHKWSTTVQILGARAPLDIHVLCTHALWI